MADRAFKTYTIGDRSYVSFIKREITNLIKEAGFTTTRAAQADIIVSELSSNLIKHASNGKFIYRLKQQPDNCVFELFCIDNGQGHKNIEKMLQDGQSTANTLGGGLGAIERLSDCFQIYSQPKWGTIVYTCLFKNEANEKTKRENIQFGEIQTSYAGETHCGDGYEIIKHGVETRIFVGDGLGHGTNAYEAVQTAIEAFKECTAPAPSEILRYIHQKVKKTRGLVANIYIYNHRSKTWRGCGVGNIISKLCNYTESKNYVGYNGIIGANIPNTITTFETEPNKYPFIILASDGIKSRWDLAGYPQLLKNHPSIIASILFKDNLRGNDDATVLVGKVN